MQRMIWSVLLLGTTGLLAGCGDPEPGSTEEPAATSSVDGGKYLLSEKPAEAADVIPARESAEDGDEVTVVGRIGGSANPWIDDRAAFTIVDNSLRACSDIPGDKCAQPWDYCCETPKLPEATALVKVVDEEGSLVKEDARKLLDVKELSTVVVQGKAQRDESGNLTILAHHVFVSK